VVALNGPLAAAIYKYHDPNTEDDEIDLKVVDLRDPHHGIGRDLGLNGDASDIALTQAGGVAWIECKSKHDDCSDPHAVYSVYRLDANAPKPRRLARGRGIAPRSLHLHGSALTWEDAGRRHASHVY
jgi:hypothetical protein